ncbi:hypothetical protein D9M70_558780 [compost metagenome]
MFVAIEAAQTDAAAWQAIGLLHAELAAVIDRVEVAIDDAGVADVDADGRAILQDGLHAVAGDGHAPRIGRVNALIPQAVLAEAQLALGADLDREPPASCGQFNLLEERHQHFVVRKWGVVIPDFHRAVHDRFSHDRLRFSAERFVVITAQHDHVVDRSPPA